MSMPSWLREVDERLARVAWSALAEPGDLDAGRFVARVGAVAALTAVYESESARPEVAGRWRVRAATLDPRRELAKVERFGGRVVIPTDRDWPDGLDDLGAARPYCLWVRGPLPPAAAMLPSVSLVGARAATSYGERTAIEIALGCASASVIVISGAAYGIDAAGHRACLRSGGLTIAVLACGVDRSYPRGNEALIAGIAEAGCLLSEVPPGSAPSRWRFLERNRVIAALSRGTVVVEAAHRSGALGTAFRALELGRAVGAVPGPVTSPMSAGCHHLLRNGGTCITDAAEAVELVTPIGAAQQELPIGSSTVAAPKAVHDHLPPADLRVLDAVPLRSPAAAAAIAHTAGLTLRDVLASLGRLEAVGLTEHRDGKYFRSIRR